MHVPTPPTPTDDVPPFLAAELAESYALATGLSDTDFGDALAVACVLSISLDARGVAGRWDLLEGRRIGDEVRTHPRAQRMLAARHGGGIVLHLVRIGELPAVRALTILRNLRFGLRTCDGSRRILDVQRQHLRDLILARCGRHGPDAVTSPRSHGNPTAPRLHH